MRCPAVFYAFLVLAAIDSQRLTSVLGIKELHDALLNLLCRWKPHHICYNGQCVPLANARCDGVTQCGDGSDEINCFSSLPTTTSYPTGCILPPQPIGGSFQIGSCTGHSCDIVPGETVPHGTMLTYRCNDNYTLAGNNISFCHTDRWYLLPSCVKTCRVLRSEGIDISCRYNGKNVSCEHTIVPGTEATLACKHSYKIPLGNDPGYRKLTCLHEGAWDRTVFHCIPECGTAIAHGRPMIVNGRRAKLGGYPWHVGVYKRKSREHWEQICAGTLISSDLVVSAAHCFWDDTIKTVKNVNRFAVAVGKYYRNYTTVLDPYVQKSLVENIHIGEAYYGLSGNYANDIALVRVQTPFTLSTVIRPICMDWDNTHEDQQLRLGEEGKAVGWGSTALGNPSVELQEINLPYIPRQDCLNTVEHSFKGFITVDKFCAGYLNGSSVCDGDSGGGLFFEFHGLWYLRGIVSVSPSFEGSCNVNSYTAFTNVGKFLDWIRTADYSRLGSGPYDEGHTFNGNNITTSITARFNNGQGLPLSYSRNYCPALRSTSVDFECKYHSEIVSCESEIVPLTTATLTCKDSYEFLPSNDPGYREITCLEDGTWDRPVIDCDFECGTSLPENFQLIVDGSLVSRHRFPWHVDIYDKFYSLSSVYAVGTLISTELVLADIHWNSNDMAGLVAARRWAVVAGQFGKGYNNYSTEPYTQKSDVTNVDIMIAPIPVLFSGTLPGIVGFRLKNRFTITTLVRPICTDWGQILGSNSASTGIQFLDRDYSLRICLANVPRQCVAQEHYFCKYEDLWYLFGVGSVQSTIWYLCSDNIKMYRLIKLI